MHFTKSLNLSEETYVKDSQRVSTDISVGVSYITIDAREVSIFAANAKIDADAPPVLMIRQMLGQTTIYCLLLEDNKYYIGKAKNVQKRFREHLAGKGAIWTKIHRPVRILETFEDCNPFLEDRYVKEYMFRHGIDNVRGGSYIKPELTPCQVYNLKQEIWMATDCCFNCGDSHYCRDCQKILVPRDFIWTGTALMLALIGIVIIGFMTGKSGLTWQVSCFCA